MSGMLNAGKRRLFRLLQGAECLFFSHRREVSQELGERSTAFEICEQRFDRNTIAGEDRSAAQDLGIDLDDGGFPHHCTQDTRRRTLP